MFLNIFLSLLLVWQIILQAVGPVTTSQPPSPYGPEPLTEVKEPVQKQCPCKSGGSSASATTKEPDFELTARSVLVQEAASGKILFEKNAGQVLPMASLTKLMTALVLIESDSDWQKIVRMETEDEDPEENGARLKVSPGEEIGFEDLFYTMLIRSCNNAAKALVRASKFTPEEFIERMNQKAKDLGMRDTLFLDPTGLSPANISTVYDLAKLTTAALKNYKIQQALTRKEYVLKTLGPNSRTIRVASTNELLTSSLNGGDYSIIGGKTGYLDEAGYCLALEVDGQGRQIVLILLGAGSKQARWQEAKEIASWVFENY